MPILARLIFDFFMTLNSTMIILYYTSLPNYCLINCSFCNILFQCQVFGIFSSFRKGGCGKRKKVVRQFSEKGTKERKSVRNQVEKRVWRMGSSGQGPASERGSFPERRPEVEGTCGKRHQDLQLRAEKKEEMPPPSSSPVSQAPPVPSVHLFLISSISSL